VTDRRFCLPPPKRGNPLWSVASLVLHAILTVVLVRVAGPTFLNTVTGPRAISFAPISLEQRPREVAMPQYGGVPEGAATGGSGGRFIGILPTARIDTVLPPPGPAFLVTRPLPPRDPEAEESALLPPGPVGYRLVGPEYGEGRVWVRTAEAELGVVGASPDLRTHAERVQAAVRDRIKAYIDTMPRDSFALPPPPRWTTEVGDDKWGMDGTWLYLGDFKIPTALLALLPLPQGNYDAAQDAAELQRMREEILDVARRSESAAEFRKYVDELRRRKQEERDAAKAKRDTTVAGTRIPDS
jgi:hypothetical protein